MKEKTKSAVKLKLRKADNGFGLFTEEPIKKGTFIIEYIGKKLTSKEADDHPNRYLFELNSRWTIDGSGRENTARYINHSCRPNCEVDIKGGKIMIFAKKNIEAGEELNYDYGKDHWNEYIKTKPTGCLCEKCQEKKGSKTLVK